MFDLDAAWASAPVNGAHPASRHRIRAARHAAIDRRRLRIRTRRRVVDRKRQSRPTNRFQPRGDAPKRADAHGADSAPIGTGKCSIASIK
ncbi:hypothetical protein [Burkholderia alba]|uniref:hypothetical protein n=1 Tax=Burkholderia alba TaxID=2683677 RepID=UPI002B0580A4|nr:hypothetical protein [Burkholderia alba]